MSQKALHAKVRPVQTPEPLELPCKRKRSRVGMRGLSETFAKTYLALKRQSADDGNQTSSLQLCQAIYYKRLLRLNRLLTSSAPECRARKFRVSHLRSGVLSPVFLTARTGFAKSPGALTPEQLTVMSIIAPRAAQKARAVTRCWPVRYPDRSAALSFPAGLQSATHERSKSVPRLPGWHRGKSPARCVIRRYADVSTRLPSQGDCCA